MNRWEKLLGFKDDPEIAEMFSNPYDAKLVQDICLGRLSEDALLQLMVEKWQINPSLLFLFRKRLLSKRRLNKAMVNLMAELHREYQTAILSNAGDQTRKLIEDVYHLDRHVQTIIISAEEGVIKPNHKFFQIAMERLNTKPEKTLLIDDYLVNILAAREFGIKAVQYINNHQVIQTVRDYLEVEG